MKKITFLMLHLNYGGLEKQTITLINELAKTNSFEIEIVSVYDILGKSFYNLDSSVKIKYLIPHGPNKEKIKNCFKNSEYIEIFKELVKGVKTGFCKYYLMKKEIKNMKTDYIFSTRIEFSKHIKRTDTINISQEHSYTCSDKYMRKVDKCFRNINYLVVMTDKAKENYSKWIHNSEVKILVIPNMIEKNEKYISNGNSKKIISVGRLEHVKGFPRLLDIFSKIVKDHKNEDWYLEIIGSGSLREKIENKIKDLNLNKNVKLIGNVPIDIVYKELSESSIFVLTSKSESFSLVLCEAMAVGLPVIAFDIDVGPREIINDGINGYLVKNRESDEMLNKVLLLINNDELRKHMGNNARQSVEKYYSNNIIEKWLDIIK